jgi:Ca2+-binding EF-hand superfamily protein
MSKSAREATDDDDDDGLEALAPRYGFSPKQIREFKQAFREFDQNGKWCENHCLHISFIFISIGDGHADADEIIVIMKKLELPSSRSEVNKLIAEVDKDGNGTIEFDEFLWMIKKLQGMNRS